MRGARRKRIDHHGGEIERLTTRTLSVPPPFLKHVLGSGRRRGGRPAHGTRAVECFGWVFYLDFASSSTRTPRGACMQMSGRNWIDPHRGGIVRLTMRTALLLVLHTDLGGPRVDKLDGAAEHVRVLRRVDRDVVDVRLTCSRTGAVMFFGWVFFLISSGSPHVRCTPMGVHRACGEPDEIEIGRHGGGVEPLAVADLW